MPLAEESGLIAGLGLLVLDETCRQLAEWDHLLGRPPRRRGPTSTSRPCSSTTTCPVRWPPRSSGTGWTPSRISIEITESALMKDPTSARDVLQQLRDLGIELAIDDFGTGYSSLAYLRHLPVDCLKVDRSFVAEMARRARRRSPRPSSPWPRTLNLCTVAEGVETLEQAEELTRLGATYLQGFSLAEPMTGGHAAAWFAAHAEDIR